MLSQPHNDHLLQAYELLHVRLFEQALAAVQRALALDPHSAEAHICSVWIWRSQGRLPEAEQAARLALAAQPDYPPAHYTLALVLWDQERLAEAETAFRRAVRDRHPLQPFYLIQFARRLIVSKRFQEARELSEQALRLDPGMSEAHRTHGLACSCLGQFAEAEAAYREALRLDPRNQAALSCLGTLALGQGQNDAAIDYFRQALQLDPQDTGARSQLVMALKARSRLYLQEKRLNPTQQGFALLRLLLLGTFILAFVIRKPQEDQYQFIETGMYFGVLALALVPLWITINEPLANTLLWFDPLGRQAHDFDPVDTALVAQALCVLLGLGLGGALLLTAGPGAPDLLRQALLGLSALLILFHGAVLAGTTWFRASRTPQIRWSDYLLVLAAPYAVIAAGLLDLHWQVPFHLLLAGTLLGLLCLFARGKRKPGA